MIPPVPFQNAPDAQQPIGAVPLIDGGPVAAMHRDLQARLLEAFPAKQFGHRTMPARMTPEEFGRLTERVPVIALGWVRNAPLAERSVRSRVWSGRAHWQVFIVVKNPRVEAQVLGDGQGAGLVGLVAVATAVLHGRQIATIGAAEVGEAGQAYSEAWARSDMAMASIAVSVPFDLVDQVGLAQLDDFLRVGVRWPGYPDVVADVGDDDEVAA